MEAMIGAVLGTSLLWYVWVLALQEKINNAEYLIKQISAKHFPLSANKKTMYSLIFYSRLYQKSRKYNNELQNVIKEMWKDARISPTKLTAHSLDCLMNEYQTERGLLSQDWSLQEFPSVSIEIISKNEMQLANELLHEG